jgi:1-acyl-sn-glycerol-3-phosphate acyltransferase
VSAAGAVLRARAMARLGLFAATTAHHGLRLVAGRAPLSPQAQARITHEWGRALCRACGLRVEVEGRLPPGGALVVANHRSYADIPVVASCAPVSFVAKAEVMRWPVIGWAAQRAGTIFLRRNDARSGAVALRAIGERHAAGVSVVVFPEGTTVGPPGIGPLSPGIFRLAARRKLPVVPMAIEYERADDAWTEPGDASFVPHFLRCFSRRAVPVRVRIGPPLRADGAEALRAAVTAWITRNLVPPGAAAPADEDVRPDGSPDGSNDVSI